MKQNKMCISVAAAFMLMLAIANAGVLDINVEESNIRLNSSIRALNYTFNVTGDENLYISNGDFVTRYRIVFLENLDRVSMAKKEVENLGISVVSQKNLSLKLQDMLEYKKGDNEKLVARLDSLGKETIILSNNLNGTDSYIESVKEDNSELENRISGNFLLSTSQTTALLVIFTILIAAVIAIEFKAYFSPSKKQEAKEAKP